MGALVMVNSGIEKGHSGCWSESMGRVNEGIEQWGLNGGIEKDQWGHWSGSMGVLKTVNGGVGHQVKQGLGCGSERGVAVGQAGGCLTGL